MTETPTTPSAIDAWAVINGAVLAAGLPVPYLTQIGIHDSPPDPYSPVRIDLRTRAEVDAWASWAGVTATIQHVGRYFYGTSVWGWRGWYELEISTSVKEAALTDADRAALAGGEPR